MPRRLYRVTLRPGEEGTFRKAAARLDEQALREAGLESLALFFQGATAWLVLEGAGDDPAQTLFESGRTKSIAEAMAKHSDFSAERAPSLAVEEAFRRGEPGNGIPFALGLRVLPGHEGAFREAARRWPEDAFTGVNGAALYAEGGDALLVLGAPDPHLVDRMVSDPRLRAILSDLDRHTDFELSDPGRDALVEVRRSHEVSGAW